jgi:hypothetical protein
MLCDQSDLSPRACHDIQQLFQARCVCVGRFYFSNDGVALRRNPAGDVDRAVLWLPLQTEHAHDLVAGKLLHGVGQAAPLSTHALIRMPKSFCVPGTGSRPAPGCQPQPTSESSAM